jgi:hypothetical protein
MKHVIAFVVKYLMVGVLLEIVLIALTSLGIGQIALIALAVSLVSYIIGDLLVLNFSNNTVATLVDLLLTFGTIYLFNYRYGFETLTYGTCAIAAVVVGVAEWFFHKFMARSVYPSRKKT